MLERPNPNKQPRCVGMYVWCQLHGWPYVGQLWSEAGSGPKHKPYWKINLKQRRIVGLAQAVEYITTKHKALSSNHHHLKFSKNLFYSTIYTFYSTKPGGLELKLTNSPSGSLGAMRSRSNPSPIFGGQTMCVVFTTRTQNHTIDTNLGCMLCYGG
jgi:hypothetical protein